jgi:hypothetical protein
MEATLKAMGERGDIIKTMQGALQSSGIEHSPERYLVHLNRIETPVVGRVVNKGLSNDELNDRVHLVVARLCSLASSLLCRSQTSLDRASAATAPHLPATDHQTKRPMADPKISRFPHKERPYMPGSQTTPGPAGTRNNAPVGFAFREVGDVGTRIDNGFAAQCLAYALPHRRFANVLTEACARIGATWLFFLSSSIFGAVLRLCTASSPRWAHVTTPAGPSAPELSSEVERSAPEFQRHRCRAPSASTFSRRRPETAM